ncbi:class I SAM-dependent methyltransferase [Methylomagnum sp.]
MFKHTIPILKLADEMAQSGQANKAIFEELRRGLSLDEFGELLMCPPAEFPHLQACLPRMAPDAVQVSWTGASGYDLLRQSTAFIREVERGWRLYAGKNPDDLYQAKIADYGCGWGRLTRLLYYFTNSDNIHAVDPWDESLRVCAECGLPGNFNLVDYVPETLPIAAGSIDLIIAFSVFTHLSENTSRKVLSALRQIIKPNGLAVITIRPVEYWDYHRDFLVGYDQDSLKAAHEQHGFAFMPHEREAVNGEITYGDTSIGFDYIKSQYIDWKIVGYDYNLIDPYQLIVFLAPV